ncbi:hypothetical protein [Lunatimonas lonarensis]|uniref:hypothetical protein n=1 Tax=Lunatimonas lonarensis TaxID=1232681 RepID=UPI00055DFB36|nr:hypothetical protein [Lunatimonas lonarensis]
METKIILKWSLRFLLLLMLYFPIWILGTMATGDLIPDQPSEPGLMDEGIALLLLGIINTGLIIGLIMTSRWNGLRLALVLGLAYYGSFTFLTQIESWYFLSETSVPPPLLPRLFLMGLAIPLIYIPLAILICGKWKKREDFNDQSNGPSLPIKQLLLKLGIIAVIYLIVYWLAGYFIAWQNPELREFYGSPGEIKPFFSHTLDTFLNTPSLLLLQLFRGVIFALVALLVLRGSNVSLWQTAFLVGLLFGIPHLVHILPNPLMSLASVRFSHMVETASSSFIFGWIVVWIFRGYHFEGKDKF